MAANDQPEAVSVDELFDLLGNARRRFVLRYLGPTGSATNIDELARELADREADAAPTERDRLRVEQSLHHVHVPKLAAAGLVEFDGADTVARAAHTERLVASLNDADRAIGGIRRAAVDG